MPTFKTIPILTKQIRFAGLFALLVSGLSGVILALLLQLQIYQSLSLLGWLLGIAGLAWFLFFKPLRANVRKTQESAQLMEMIIQNAPDQILCVRFPEGSMDIVNKTMCEMLGYSEEQLISMRVFEVDMQFTEKSWDQMAAQMNEMRRKLEMGELLTFRTRHRTSDNRILDVEIRVYKIEFHGVHYEVCFVRDITQDIQTIGDDFQTLLARQKALLNNIPHIAWMKDGHSRYVAVNDAYSRFCNRKIEDIIGKTSFDIWPKAIAERYQTYEQSMMEASSMDASSRLHIEEELCDAKGNQAWYEIFQTPIFDPSNFIIRGVVGIAQDISQRKADEETIKNAKIRLEQELQERKLLESQLTQLDKLKTRFFSNISHEFRTPLTLILGAVEDTLRNSMISPEAHEEMSMAHRNTLRLLKLVNTLLDFSRIEAGRIEATYRPVDLARFTTELASNFCLVMEKAGLSFIVDCPPLPELIYVDVEMWEKIVFNLISNAFKNTFTGEIRISLIWRDDHVELSVQDTGIGIAKDQLDHLFERFYRVSNVHSRTQEGSGIGLALIKELVNFHKGAIWVKSEVGIGSAFTVSIPRGYAHLPPERVLSDVSSQVDPIFTRDAQSFVEEAFSCLPQEFENTGSINALPVAPAASAPGNTALMEKTQYPVVLLADDNRDMRSYVERLLKPYYRVVTVSDGQAALESLSQHPADLVLTDIMMPRLDGFGLLKAIREDAALKTTPVIMLSARAGEEASIEGLSSGADDYLIKPFSANELLARVRSHVEMARIRKEAEEALLQAQKMEVVGQLAGGTAHDFNSLLTVIMGRLQLLKGYVVNDEKGQRTLASACNAAERAAKLIKQLLAFARKQPLEIKAVSLNALIVDMDNLLQNALRDNISLERNLTPDLWLALADSTQIQLALLNLVLNACYAMPQGGTIIIATRNVPIDKPLSEDLGAGEYILLSVSDTGSGMSKEVLARAFEPFFTTKGVGEGSGLGLSQVYGTVKQLGGTVLLKSSLGQGTTVEIFLPRTV